LGDPASRRPLLEALADVDRLVLLGDVVELRELPLRDALAAASRVLTGVGRALRPGCEVVLVPGNHDHYLLAPWLDRRAAAGPPEPLGLETAVAFAAGDPLAVLAEAVSSGGATVRAAYPGVWLREDVYATHGHYLDRHTTVPMLERLGVGAMGWLLRRAAAEAQSAEDYEAVLSPLYAWIHAMAQTTGPVGAAAPGASARVWKSLDRGAGRGGVRRRALRAAGVGGVRALNRAGLGPLRADLSAGELRRAGLLAMGSVTASLSIDARWVLFGHTHRAGPLPGDDPGEWIAPGGARLINTGCWVHEPAFLGPRPQSSPYRSGFAVRLAAEPGTEPELVNLLDP
jgi:hypothetical protein